MCFMWKKVSETPCEDLYPSAKVNPSSALSSEICRSCSEVLKLSSLQFLCFKAGYCCSSQPDELPAAILSYSYKGS